MRGYKKSKLADELGFRSNFEVIVNQQLIDSGVPFSYEGPMNKVNFVRPAANRTYLADFLLSNGIIIEAKGRFTTEDRKKHCLIKEQHPILDIRFLFTNARKKLRKGSKTTYAQWCDKIGFLYAQKFVPKEWIEFKRPKKELEEIKRILRG